MAIKKKLRLPCIGSMKKETKSLWICEGSDMVYRPVSYVPGFQKIMDELIVNAADNKQRDPKMNSLKIDIDVEGNKISVYDNREGVPVRVHLDNNGRGEDVYLPETMFVPFIRDYYFCDDGEKKTTGSRIGYGMALANLFSTEFVIEIADGTRKKMYQQVFTDHMETKSKACITEFNSNENWTKVVFKPDLEKFDMTHLDADTVKFIKKRVIDVAGCLGETVKVKFNGETIPVKSVFQRLCQPLYAIGRQE